MTIKINPETVRLNLSGGSNVGSLHFHDEAARYHIWVNLEPLEPRVDHTGGRPRVILYKNPPLGLGYSDAGYFPTRHLDATAAANKPTVDRLFEIARERDVITIARAERDKAARVAALRDEERRILRVQRELGPQLLELLRAISDHVESKRAADPAFVEEGRRHRDRMIELIRLADAPREEGRRVEVRDRRKPATPPSIVYAVNDRAAIESACLGRVNGIVLNDVLPEDIEVVSSAPLNA
jgi:hypothetical protein